MAHLKKRKAKAKQLQNDFESDLQNLYKLSVNEKATPAQMFSKYPEAMALCSLCNSKKYKQEVLWKCHKKIDAPAGAYIMSKKLVTGDIKQDKVPDDQLYKIFKPTLHNVAEKNDGLTLQRISKDNAGQPCPTTHPRLSRKNKELVKLELEYGVRHSNARYINAQLKEDTALPLNMKLWFKSKYKKELSKPKSI